LTPHIHQLGKVKTLIYTEFFRCVVSVLRVHQDGDALPLQFYVLRTNLPLSQPLCGCYIYI